MTNRKYLLGLFSIFFITTILAGQNRVLWDLGVVIKAPIQEKNPDGNMNSLSEPTIDPASQVAALITNPFIPPVLSSLNNKVYDATIFLAALDEVSLNNIPQVKLLASRLTMNINYQPVIDMMDKIDFSKLNEHDYLDLNYLLANSFLKTGQYKEAEDVILANMTLAMDDRFHFLLARTYEAQGRIQKAQNEYFVFIKQFPQSDYTVTALIKARMLGRR